MPDHGALAAEDFVAREDAQRTLLDWALEDPGKRLDSVLAAYMDAEDPELRQRLHGTMARVHQARPKGFVGITMRHSDEGVLITGVQEETPAAAAEMRAGDLIVSANGVPLNRGKAFEGVSNSEFFSNEIKSYQPGDQVKLVIMRGGKKVQVDLVLGVLPSLESRMQVLEQGFQRGFLNQEAARREEALQERPQFERWLEREMKKRQKKKPS
ncbi:MAG: PDZ domain-containing protein [Verrucomicrobiales bacterium]